MHHRWLVEFADNESIVFRMKPYDLGRERRYVPVTRLHTVQWARQANGMFWRNAVSAREEIYDIRSWIDQRLSQAQAIVKFDPLGRILDKLRRTTGGKQPALGHPAPDDNVKYPYL